MDRQADENELAEAVEAADRAGAIVTDRVRSIIEAAESRAAEIDSNARSEAQDIRRQAHESATRLLESIDGFEGALGTLVKDLRREADELAKGIGPRS